MSSVGYTNHSHPLPQPRQGFEVGELWVGDGTREQLDGWVTFNAVLFLTVLALG